MAVNYAQYQQTVNPLEIAMKGANLAQAAQSMEFNKAKMAEYQRVLDKKAKFEQAIKGLGSNPTPKQYSDLILQFPEMTQALKGAYDTQTEARRLSDVNLNMQIFSALDTGNDDVALTLLQEQLDGAENSGDTQRADALKGIMKIYEIDPEAAKKTAGLSLAAAMGPDKFAESYQKINKAQIESRLAGPQLEKAKADAAKAASEAKFSESTAAIDLANKGLDVGHLITDPSIKKQNQKIAAATRAATNAKNEQEERKRLLDIQKLEEDREALILEKGNKTIKGLTAIDTLLNNANEILDLANADAGLLGNRRAIDVATGAMESRFPTVFSQSAADFEAAVESLNAQIFLNQVENMRGLGQLTEEEGKRLVASLDSLSLKQSAERLEKNIKNIQELMLKARDNAEREGHDFAKIYGRQSTPATSITGGRQLTPTTSITVGGKKFTLVPTP
jgi:hypothetical protein